jgi:two-component system, OmpR family, sensor histidine kinase KdpD
MKASQPGSRRGTVPKRSTRVPTAFPGGRQEHFRTALFHALSHDLKTPLTVIAGSLSTLLKEGDVTLDEAARRELLETAYAGVERLIRLVDGLLPMAKLEANMLDLRLEPHAVEEVIGAAIAQLGALLDGHRCRVDLPPDFPLVSFDFALMVHVLVNVMDNAITHSPKDSLIEVRVSQTPGHFILSVSDRGIGIPPKELDWIFERVPPLTRESNDVTSGRARLGLDIAKGIVEAHGGRIWAEGREGGGTIVTVSLPLK